MDSQWLKTQFALYPDKTKADLAKALGLEAPAISKILGGGRQIKAHEYAAMRRFFGLPVDGETAAKPYGLSYTIAPLEHDTGLGEQEQPGTEPDWVIPASILSTRTQAPPEKIKKFQVRESAMEPDFKQGEHVLIDLSDQTPSPPGVFVVSDGFGYMMRHCAFIPKTNPPEVRISATGAGFHSQILKLEDFIIVGRVIAKLQMV
jgi:transcriptional regulator with XRE-family HTH domain